VLAAQAEVVADEEGSEAGAAPRAFAEAGPAEIEALDAALFSGRARRAPLFLNRDSYRRRRVMDAARLLPLFGAALLLMPVLWAEGHSTAMGAVYLFVAWLGLIVTAAILSRRLSEPLRRRVRDPEQ
jgi:hypothetical protein